MVSRKGTAGRKLSAILVMLISCFVWAGDYEKGLEAAEVGDYTEALDLWRPIAERGDALAQRGLGFMFNQGMGVIQDYTEAVRWYRKAANQGDPKAQYYLAEMYREGLGVTQDYTTAKKWFLKSAEQGFAEAQANLGALYTTGQAKDYALAAKWFRKAALQGVTRAQNNIAALYFNGQGVRKNEQEAAQWLTKAAEQGHASAQHSLGAMYALGQGVRQSYPEAIKWYQRAAEQGNKESQYSLGAMYEDGEGVPSDYSKAVLWYQKAAKQGHIKAQKALINPKNDGASRLRSSLLTNRELEKLRQTATAGDGRAQYDLGNLYFKGQGVGQDYTEAHSWFSRAIRLGNTDAAIARDLVIDLMSPEQLMAIHAAEPFEEYVSGFDSFSAESAKVAKELHCRRSHVSPPSFDGDGKLYSCIQGSAETAKWFINELPNTNKVKNIKLMWNDWFINLGYGLHADSFEAQEALNLLIHLYAPGKSDELKDAFRGTVSKTINAAPFLLKYRYTRGPAIDERLIVVTER